MVSFGSGGDRDGGPFLYLLLAALTLGADFAKAAALAWMS